MAEKINAGDVVQLKSGGYIVIGISGIRRLLAI